MPCLWAPIRPKQLSIAATAFPCADEPQYGRSRCAWVTLPGWYGCAHAWGTSQAVGFTKPWVGVCVSIALSWSYWERPIDDDIESLRFVVQKLPAIVCGCRQLVGVTDSNRCTISFPEAAILLVSTKCQRETKTLGMGLSSAGIYVWLVWRKWQVNNSACHKNCGRS